MIPQEEIRDRSDRTSRIKWLAWANAVGFPLNAIVYGVSLLIEPIPWGELLFILFLVIVIPFTVCGVITLRNLTKLNPRQVQILTVSVMMFLIVPSSALPSAFEWGGWLILLTLVAIAVIAVRVINNPLKKLELLNYLGFIFLLLCSLMVVSVVVF